MWCGHGLVSQCDRPPRPNAISMNSSYSCGVVTYDKVFCWRLWDLGVSWSLGFVLKPTSTRWFLKEVQVIMKHDPICCHVEIHVDSTSILHSLIRMVPWVCSVKWAWNGSTFPTNESAWIVMVTGSQSHVWSGPKATPRVFRGLP
jgi:hypothetical protein